MAEGRSREAWQERVIEEERDLSGKIERLSLFMADDRFAALDEDEQCRLDRQIEAMRDYQLVLKERIACF